MAGSWEGFNLEMTIIIGNDEHQLLFQNYQHYDLSEFPTDTNGNVICKVYLNKKSLEYEELVVLRKERDLREGVARQSRASQQATKAFLAPRVSHEPGDNEDLEIHDTIQLRRPRQSPNRQVEFQMEFVGLKWSRTKPTFLRRDARFKMIDSCCVDELTILV